MDKLIFALGWLTKPTTNLPESKRRQAHLLAWLLLFILLFIIATFFIVLIFNPHNDPQRNEYCQLIFGLVVFVTIAYVFNRFGYYNISAGMIVVSAVIAPWASLLLDPSILQEDFVPLTSLTLSVLLSSILLPTFVTIVLAILQGLGISLFLLLKSFHTII